MPEVCRFYGIRILFFFDEHPPAHFHASYGEFVAQIEIESLEVLEGYLPPRVIALVREWGEQHRSELHENWRQFQNTGRGFKIAPLS